MSIKLVRVCDGCNKILTKTNEIYYLDLTTDEFWGTTETDYLQEHFEFCLECAKDIKKTLEKIALKKD